VKRISLAFLLAAAVLGIATAAISRPVSAIPHGGGSAAAPMAAIDINGIFGNENEPDENEAGDGGPTTDKPQSQGSGGFLPLKILLIIIGGVVVVSGAAGVMLVRLLRRAKTWTRGRMGNAEKAWDDFVGPYFEQRRRGPR
jgi:hypothetical protein